MYKRQALVGVADHVLLMIDHLAHGRPLEPGGVTAATTPAQAAGDDLLHHFGRRHFAQRVHQGGVAACGDVAVQAVGIDDAGVLQHHALLAGEEGLVGRATQPLHGFAADTGQQFLGIVGLDVAVQHRAGQVAALLGHRHQGAG